jgi:hypothetical protein
MGDLEEPDLMAPEYRGPMIVGFTHTPWGNPIPGGAERWARMTPEERFWASDLGKAFEMSQQYDPEERRDPGAFARKIASKGDYWGGLAKNIMRGSDLPEARVPFQGVTERKNTVPTYGIEGEPLPGLEAQRAAAPKKRPRTQAPRNWSEIGRETQQKIKEAAEKMGITTEEALQLYYAVGGR